MDGRSDAKTLRAVRRALVITLVLGLLGTGIELILLGHIDGATQYIPVVLISIAFAVSVWHAIRPSTRSVQVLRVLMGSCVLAGALGVALHYRGNLEFELEMYPTMSGTELVTKVATGATPLLAPGSLSLLGVIGLLHAYRHPALDGDGSLQEERS